MKKTQRVAAAAMAAGLTLSLAACGSDDDGGDAGGSAADCAGGDALGGQLSGGVDAAPAVNANDAAVAPANHVTSQRRTAAEPGGDITLGIIGSWTDGLSMAHLWNVVLEDMGYNVEIKNVADAAPLYTGVAQGDVDVYPSAWPEVTHASYMEEYGDDLEVLGTYYEGAKLTFAVPEYVEIDSIEDLVGCGDVFDGTIVGIEPGAGLTQATEESVIPDYGLDDEYELKTSSTQGMLTELQTAVENEDPIVVTLWRPFWANSEFPVKDLEDPKGALGEAEGLAAVANADFSSEFPEVAEMMANATLDDDQYGSLEDLVVNEFGEGKEDEAVEQWLEDNPDWVDTLTE